MRDNTRVLIYFLEMALFLVMLIFTIMKGPENPQIVFCGFMFLFVIVIVNEVRPKLKDFIILIAGMIFLAIGGTIADKLVKFDNIVGFIIKCVIVYPFFIPVWNHFIKMCTKIKDRW